MEHEQLVVEISVDHAGHTHDEAIERRCAEIGARERVAIEVDRVEIGHEVCTAGGSDDGFGLGDAIERRAA